MAQSTVEIEEDASERLTSQWSYMPSFQPPRQSYVVLSILCPDGTNQTLKSGFAIKVYGCFGTMEEADHFATLVSQECDAFDVFSLETAQWARLPPEVARLEDVHYQQEKLEALKKRAASERDESAARMRDRLFGAKAMRMTEIENNAAIMDVDEASTSRP